MLAIVVASSKNPALDVAVASARSGQFLILMHAKTPGASRTGEPQCDVQN